MKRLATAVALGVAAPAAVLIGAAGPASAAGNASVSVVHGIPGTPVNVFVNGTLTLPDFTPGTVAGPLSLPAGSYQVKVFPAANKAGTGNPVLQATATVTSGQNVVLVAHLDAGGKPALTPFVNNTAKIPAGQARLVVRHTAAAPAVDVRAGGSPVVTGLTNPRSRELTVPAGTVKADVVLAGTSTVAIGPASLDLREGTETIVYAIGSAGAKNLSLVTQTISGLHSAPGGVPAGSGGLADTGPPAWVPAAAVLGLVAAAAGGLGLARTRTAAGR
jgi:Domain of unknown function (DUF4397)